MKRTSPICLLLVAILMAFAFSGCNTANDVKENTEQEIEQQDQNVEQGAEQTQDAARKTMEFVLMNYDDIPDKVKAIADQSVGKELFFSVKHDGAFYGILSHADKSKKYTVASVENNTIGTSEFVTVNLKEEAVKSGESSVTVYKASELLDLEGLAFQMDDNKAISGGENVETQKVGEAEDSGSTESAAAEVEKAPTKITINEPKENAVIEGGSIEIGGSMDGLAKSVTCQLVSEDGTILGEKSSPVSDLSMEFNAKISYTLAQAETRAADGTVSGYVKVIYTDDAGKANLEASIPVKVK